MPTFEELENPKENLATKVISSDQMLLGTYFRENRAAVSYDDLSKHLTNALIATEDIRFQEHCGIDFRALPRVFAGMLSKSQKGGGSTISQQLAKMLFPRQDNMSKIKMINRKFQEWVIAVKLEKNYTKEEIIAMYLNKFDFLNLAVGIESAARVYFNTVPDSLKVQDAAMLVGMCQNPSIYNPLRFPERCIERRTVVLSQMRKYNYITKNEYDSLKDLPLEINYQKVDHNVGQATYFREFLRLWLTAKKPIYSNYIDKNAYIEDSINWVSDPSYGWCNKNIKPDGNYYDIYKDGLSIYTTINSRMQRYAEQAVKEHMSKEIQPAFFKDMKNNKKAPFAHDLSQDDIDKIMYATMRRTERWRVHKADGLSENEILEQFNIPTEMKVFSWRGDIDTIMTPKDSVKYYKYYLRAGFMSMEPQTGYVKAYVAGIDYKYFKFDQVNRSRRQVGSTFKPFIYCLAMQEGKITPCKKIPNVEVSIEIPNQPVYTPKFSKSKKDGEMITLKYGLANSLNQTSTWVLKQVTPDAVVNLAKKMGVNSYIDPVPSICTGAAEVLLSEMVGAYCAFANKGMYIRPIYIMRIEDKDGNVISNFSAHHSEPINEETAYLMIDLLKGVTEYGTGASLRGGKYNFTGEMIGKTGTTNDNSDGWYIGGTPELVSGAWVGGEERSIRFRYMDYGQGARLALPIWGLYMKKVFDDKNLPYSKDTKFERPEKLSVEIDCEKYEKNEKNKSKPDFNQ